MNRSQLVHQQWLTILIIPLIYYLINIELRLFLWIVAILPQCTLINKQPDTTHIQTTQHYILKLLHKAHKYNNPHKHGKKYLLCYDNK